MTPHKDRLISIMPTASSISNSRYKKLLNKKTVSLITYPRLHMFSLDLSLTLGHLKSGSMGVSLSNMPIHITVSATKNSSDTINLPSNIDTDVTIDLNSLRKYLDTTTRWDIDVELGKTLSSHTGLGLSTQIVGGTLLCCAKTIDKDLSLDDLFKLGLGHVSALGIKLLYSPGMIVEDGYRLVDKSSGIQLHPELNNSFESPSSFTLKIDRFPWYIIVGIPYARQSLSGEAEKEFWSKHFPDTPHSTVAIVHKVYQQLLPAIANNDYDSIIEAMNHVTNLGTKPHEETLQSAQTKSVLLNLRNKYGFATVSSMGPTVYAFSKHNPTSEIENLSNTEYTFYAYRVGSYNGGDYE